MRGHGRKSASGGRGGQGQSQSSNTKQRQFDQRSPWICIKCENAIEEGNEEVMECHGCKEWCHKACTELTGSQYNCLKHGGNFIQWFCEECREEDGGGKGQKSRLEAKMDNILKVLTSVHDRLDKLEGKQRENLREVESKIEEVVERKVKDYMEESEEKEKRKLNIIICNLPESSAETPEERKNEDQERVRDLVGKISDVQRNEVNNPVRLGKIQIGSHAKPRLLRMEVKTEEAKKKIMRNVQGLNKDVREGESRIYINNDTTKKERELIKSLKTELNQRKTNGETNLRIDYKSYRIVTFTPRQNQNGAVAGQGPDKVQTPETEH